MASTSSSSTHSRSSSQSEIASPEERDYVQGKRALQCAVRYLLGKNYEQVVSPAHKATPAFISKTTGVTIGVIPVGSYALGLWSSPEPIVCCCLGTPSDATFFKLAKRAFQKSAQPALIIERSSLADATFELNIDTIPVHLKYHQNPFITRWNELADAPSTIESLEALPSASRRRFTEVEETNNVARTVKDTSIHSYFWITRRWALIQGLVSRSFNGLTDWEILSLAFAAFSEPRNLPGEAKFITSLCEMKVDSESLAMKAADMGLRRFSLSKNKSAMIQWAQARTLELLTHSAVNFDKHVSDWEHFLTSYAKYVRIDISFWALSTRKGGRFVRAAESATSRLVERLIRRCPFAFFHIWPRSFLQKTQSDTNDTVSGVDDFFAASYFIACGLLKGASSDFDSFPDDDFLLTSFLNGLRNARWEDSTSTYTNIETLGKIDIEEWIPDHRTLGPVPEDLGKDDSSDDEGQEDLVESWHRELRLSAPKSTQENPKLENLEIEESSSRPLRPALDILHRIQYDTSMDTSDYIVGYLDRHSGILEMPVEWWASKDASSDEFIPQSRIRFFKRKSDQVVVWDREQRKDLVFGSGRTR
ncbi:hypothetical protein MMC10_000015 [Thelotrema lepadinum]|nr:hypothetical protein [Thelotrema lepadinum]